MDAVIKQDMFIAEVKAIIWAAYHAGQFKERERIQIITPIELAGKLFSIHTHAELVFIDSPDQIVYKEEDIVALLEKLGQPKPDWDGHAKQLRECSQEEFVKKLKDKAEGVGVEVIDERELLSPPGDTILETMKELELISSLTAELMGISLSDFVLLTAGKLPITEEIALKLETVLGIDKQFWLNREKLYRDKLAELNKTKP